MAVECPGHLFQTDLVTTHTDKWNLESWASAAASPLTAIAHAENHEMHAAAMRDCSLPQYEQPS